MSIFVAGGLIEGRAGKGVRNLLLHPVPRAKDIVYGYRVTMIPRWIDGEMPPYNESVSLRKFSVQRPAAAVSSCLIQAALLASISS
jgi:hypothetical protein